MRDANMSASVKTGEKGTGTLSVSLAITDVLLLKL
jgi:hypothetical protein